MKLRRISITFLIASAFALNAFAVDPPEPEAEVIRPTGIEKAPKERASKKRRARSTRKSAEEPFVVSTPAPGSAAPLTGARAVMIVDARNGQTLYEKNADELRAPASTQKLLTALIIAERGELDRPVQVEAIDTLAEPVKLNIKPGDVISASICCARCS